MKNVLVVYTPNPVKYEWITGSNGRHECHMVYNTRFNKLYNGEFQNYDRLTLVGRLNYETKEMMVGVSLCSYPDNFSRVYGKMKASSKSKYKKSAYAIYTFEDFTVENCLTELYDLHKFLIGKPIEEVKKLISKQRVK